MGLGIGPLPINGDPPVACLRVYTFTLVFRDKSRFFSQLKSLRATCEWIHSFKSFCYGAEMYSDTTRVRYEFDAVIGTAAAIELPPNSVGRDSSWLNRVLIALLVIAVTSLKLVPWHDTPRPYPSAPAYCATTAKVRRTADITPAQALAAAVNSYSALKACFGGPLGSFQGPYVGLASAWPESQALAAMLGLSGISKTSGSITDSIEQNISVLRNYWDPKGGYFPSGRWFATGVGIKKFDDNAWLGMDLANAYLLTRNPAYLNQAEAVAKFEATGWSSNKHFAFPGGVFWQEPKYGHHRNAVSTAGAALLNAQLFAITGAGLYRNRAEEYLHWTVSALTLKNGMIGDQISADGIVSKNIWSYNQGLVIATYTSLYKTTKNPIYLAAAELLAEHSLRYFGTDRRLELQPQVFDAIYLRSLAELYSVAPNSEYLHTLRSYATYLFQRMVPSTGVIRRGPMTSSSTSWLLTQAAATQVFTIYAAMAGHAVRT